MRRPAGKERTAPEKRKHSRVPVNGAATILRGAACLGRCWMINLSPGGVLVAGELPLRLLDRVSLRLEIGTHAVAMEATVVRLEGGRPNPRVAFAFDRLVNEQLIANIVD